MHPPSRSPAAWIPLSAAPPLAVLLAFVACGPAGSPAAPGLSAPGMSPPDAGAPPPSCTQLPVPDGGLVHVTGLVLDATGDAAAPKPIPNAMIAVEYGGVYLPWCDLSHASPYCVFGAFTDAAGAFGIDVRAGALGFHSFATGYYYTRATLDTSKGGTVTLTMEPLQSGKAKPTATNVGFDKATVHGGDTVTFSATIATWSAQDPLSDENLIVEPTHSWSSELDPPSVGKKDDFPDGLWKKTLKAPSTPGSYVYWFSATTAGCVTSDLVSATLTVQ